MNRQTSRYALALLLACTTGGARAKADDVADLRSLPVRAVAHEAAAERAAGGRSAAGARYNIGPEFGVFLPSNGKTRDRFGGTWLSIGPGVGPVEEAPRRGHTAFDFNLFYQTSGPNHAYILPLGLNYRIGLTEGQRITPYVGASADLFITDLRSDPDDVRSRFRLTGGGSLFIGANLSARSYVEARYYAISPVRGFDLSGVNLTLGFRF